MRIHTALCRGGIMDAVYAARERGARIVVEDFSTHGSRSHDRAFEVRLGGSSRYAAQGLDGVKAATWDEWGLFIAEVFKRDPGAKVGFYKKLEQFIDFTSAEAARPGGITAGHKAPWLNDDELMIEARNAAVR